MPQQSTQHILLPGVQSRHHDLALQSLPIDERARGEAGQRQGTIVDHRQEGDTGTRVSRGGTDPKREQKTLGRPTSFREAVERLSRQTRELRCRPGTRNIALLSQIRSQDRAEISQ